MRWLGRMSLVLVVTWGFHACDRQPRRAVPLETLIRYLDRHRLPTQEADLLSAYLSQKGTDARQRFLRAQRHPLRALYFNRLDRLVLEALSGRTPRPVAPQPLRQLATDWQTWLGEPVLTYNLDFLERHGSEHRRVWLEGRYHQLIGDSLRATKNYLGAAAAYQRALSAFEDIDNLSGVAAAKYSLAEALHRAGRKRESLELCSEAYDAALEVGDVVVQQHASYRMGVLTYELRHYQNSLTLLRRAAELARRLDSRRIEARALSMIATVYEETGQPLKSLPLHRQCVEIYDKLDRPLLKSAALRRLGFAYTTLGDYDQAIAAHRQSLKIAQSLDEPLHVASQLNNLGEVYNLLGDYERALRFHKQAVEIVQQLGVDEFTALGLASIGSDYVALGKLDTAITYFRQALQVAEAPDLEPRRAEIFQQYGEALLTKGDRREAEELFRKAFEINSANGYKEGLVLNLLGLGEVALQTGRLDVADNRFQAALRVALKARLSNLIWKAYYKNGRVWARRGHFKRALRYFNAAIDTIESGRARISEQRFRIGYLATRQQVYDQAASIYLQQLPDPRKALELVERAKARAFLDVLSGDVEVASEHLRMTPESDGPSVKIKQAALELPAIAELQKRLRPDEVVLEFHVFDEQVGIWLVSRDRVRAKRIPARRAVLRRWVRDFRKIVGADGSDDALRAQSLAEAEVWYQRTLNQARRLTRLLLAPIWSDLAPYPKVYLVPDDVLHYLPFAALTNPADSTRFVIESKTLARSPSAAVLASLLRRPLRPAPRPLHILSVADPELNLQGARAVGNFLARNAPGSRVLFGSEATEPALLRALRKTFTVVDFGTHCTLNERNPLYTALHLADGRKRTGGLVRPAGSRGSDAAVDSSRLEPYLLMHEVFKLPLSRTPLVALPACETALGRFARGEGLVGLSRAFFYAGASTVIATLWKVDDAAAADIMTDFYTMLLRQRRTNAAAALRAAQMAQIRRLRNDAFVRFPHPYFWAGFVTTGRMNFASSPRQELRQARRSFSLGNN